MKIRRFTGRTMQQALKQVKAALGADAVILETAEGGDGVTVTAAVDAGEAPAAPGAGDRELAREVRSLLGVVHELLDGHWREGLPGLAPDLQRLHRGLLAQGVDGVIAAALVRETAERIERGTPLAAALAGTLERPLTAGAARRIRLFVGPPGDGKTTTIVKLAAQARRAGRRVALVSTDTYRVGAAAELGTYGRVLGVPVAAAADPEALAGVLAGTAEAELVLVDTAGVGPGQKRELGELAALVRAAGGDAACTLVASAATGSWAAWQTWRAFAPLAPDAGVLTKCDVAPGGPMLGLLWRRGVPVSHVTAGRRIPDDLEPATAERLARCLLAA